MERVKQLNYFLKIVGETKVLANHVILNKQVAMKVATLHKIKGPLRLQELEAGACHRGKAEPPQHCLLFCAL